MSRVGGNKKIFNFFIKRPLPNIKRKFSETLSPPNFFYTFWKGVFFSQTKNLKVDVAKTLQQ